jgi:enterochelin esterase-like enzyme
MADSTKSASQRLRALAADIDRGRTDALTAFWTEMAERNTPLIEAIDGETDHSLVTFLWRAGAATTGVELISLISGLEDNDLRLMPGTDVWHGSWPVANDVLATYQFFPRIGEPSEEDASPMARLARYVHDPLNPHTYTFERDEEDPDGFELVRSVLRMPKAAAQPLNERGADVAAGMIEMHRLRSGILENERRVWVYKPAGYDPERGEAYDLLVLFDGAGFARMSPLPAILDNLTASGAIPPLVAVMPCSLSQELRLKELLLHEPFNRFLSEELMPWIHEGIHATEDPQRTVVAGASAGGIAAAHAAFERPELFGNVLSLSGAFSYAPGMLNSGWVGEHEWLARRIAASDKRPVRFYLSAGTLETKSLRNTGDGPNLLVANRHLRTVLEAKGHSVWLSEFPGGHDMISWQGVIPEGLITLLGDRASA